MATRRLTRQEKQEQTRTAILRSAATLFARRGVEGTSMEDVARHAGLTQGAIYSNFASKADLWWAIAEQISRTIVFEDLFTGDRDLRDEMRDAGAMGAEIIRDTPRTDLLLNEEFNMFVLRDPKARARYKREMRECEREIGKKFEAIARKRGTKLPMSGERLSTLMNILADGIIRFSLIDPERIDEEFCADAFALLAGCGEA